MRGTGGNRFIHGDATTGDLVSQIWRQLEELRDYAPEIGRRLDLAAISVDTLRAKDGRISVSVTADLSKDNQ